MATGQAKFLDGILFGLASLWLVRRLLARRGAGPVAPPRVFGREGRLHALFHFRR